MTKEKQQFPQKHICMIDFTFWKGEQILYGQEIEVTKEDWKNRGLRNKLARAFRPVKIATIVSEPIKPISEKEAKIASKPKETVSVKEAEKKVEEK